MTTTADGASQEADGAPADNEHKTEDVPGPADAVTTEEPDKEAEGEDEAAAAPIRSRGVLPEHATWVLDTLYPYLDHMEDPSRFPHPPVSTGFADLDSLLTGLEAGTLTVIAGRPRVGKSTLLSNFARCAAIKQQVPTLWIDQESPRRHLLDRIMSAEARVPLDRFRMHTLDDEDWASLAKTMGRVGASPLALRTGGRVDVDQVRTIAQEAGARLVAIDGLQQMRPIYPRETREHEVSDAVRALKEMALELEVAVVATAHLNRAPLQRTSRSPSLDDLRESDLIAHMADTIILIDRPELHDKGSSRLGEADLIVAKHRNGPTCDVTVAFQGHYSRFIDMLWG